MFYLGIDGGGTSCRARLETTAGELLGLGQAGPANVANNPQQAQDNILAASADAIRAANLSVSEEQQVHAVLGLAGYNLAAGRVAMDRWSSPFASTLITTDMHIACAGAHAGADGAIMIIGTGSSACLRLSGHYRELGGYGFPIGDQASGASMGLALVQHCLLVCDQLEPQSELVERVLHELGVTSGAGLAEAVHRVPPADFARLAPLIFEYAGRNEPLAQSLIANATAYIERMVNRLTELGAPRIALVGGLSRVLSGFLPAKLQTQLSEPLKAPVEGAALLARQQRH